MTRLPLLLAAGLALALCVPAAAPAGVREADRKLESALERIVAVPDGPPGVAAVVQRGEVRRIHAAGRANVNARGPIRAHQHMRIASVTKAFTGATLLRLVERTRLSLNSAVGEIRPDLPAEWHGITLRQLLYHTSGLPNYTATPAFQAHLPGRFADYISPRQMVDFAATEPLEFPPGTGYEYSNTDNIVMALMAERVTGKPFAKLLKHQVFRPLRLRDTSFNSRLSLPKPYVRGYVFEDPDAPLFDISEELNPSGAWAAGAIVSSQRDLNTFVRAWAGGTLLKSRKLRRAQTAFLPPFTGGEPPGPGQNRGGLTLYRYRTPCGVVFGHSGNFPGYTQWIAATPDGTRSAVVTANMALSPPSTGSQEAFVLLRRAFRRAACAALAN